MLAARNGIKKKLVVGLVARTRLGESKSAETSRRKCPSTSASKANRDVAKLVPQTSVTASAGEGSAVGADAGVRSAKEVRER